MFWLRLTAKRGTWFGNHDQLAGALKVGMQDSVQSPEIKEKIIPQYEIGVKRPVCSDTYLQAMNRPNFRLITDGIKSITEDGIITKTNNFVETDVLITATGETF